MDRDTDEPQDDRGYGEEGRTAEEQDRAAEGKPRPSTEKNDAPVPGDPDERDGLVDEASEDSFPASDPPSYWQRPTTSETDPR